MKKQYDIQDSDKPGKTHDFTTNTKEDRFEKFIAGIILLALMSVGVFLLYNWRQTGIIGILFGLFFVGVGIIAFGSTFIYKFFVPPKDIMAQLVSIDATSEHFAGIAQYELKYQDENGKLYTFYKKDIDFKDIELHHVYKINVQGSQVKEIGALISGPNP